MTERDDGYYGCRRPPGACGCPQNQRYQCQHAHWISRHYVPLPEAHRAHNIEFCWCSECTKRLLAAHDAYLKRWISERRAVGEDVQEERK